MEAKQLFIPEKIKVGYQKREGTYTGQLAYVIYYDQKGKLRKETSWEGWRDKKIAANEFKNEPTEGFVLNKGVGGQRQSYGWNARNEYIRVYDPRDFEFEISVANLLFILRECDCNKGKGLEGKFVYAWDGTELVLLPEKCDDYKNSHDFTNLQNQKIASKDLIAGATYQSKRQENLTYVGRFDYFYLKNTKDIHDRYGGNYVSDSIKKYVFWDGKKLVLLNDLKTVAVLVSDAIHPDLADLTQKYYKTEHGSKIVGFELKKKTKKELDEEANYGRQSGWSYQDDSVLLKDVFYQCTTNYVWRGYGQKDQPRTIDYVSCNQRIFIENEVITVEEITRRVSTQSGNLPDSLQKQYWNRDNWINYQVVPWIEPTEKVLYAILESGAKFKFNTYSFSSRS